MIENEFYQNWGRPELDFYYKIMFIIEKMKESVPIWHLSTSNKAIKKAN